MFATNPVALGTNSHGRPTTPDGNSPVRAHVGAARDVFVMSRLQRRPDVLERKEGMQRT
jgi:hypothetical protein